MRMHQRKNKEGFTLLEMLLVLVIISVIIYAAFGYLQQRTIQMRVDRTTIQMQQILNASLSDYVTNGSWPGSVATMQGTFLPPSSVTLQSPWGNQYSISVYSPTPATGQPTPPPQLYVWTPITSGGGSNGTAAGAANIIAGTLPLAYTTTDTSGTAGSPGQPPVAGSTCSASSSTCFVVASVNIPGQNLNNARAVNFAGLYHNGACVPVPQCPVDNSNNTMIPQIMVVPVSVSGLNDNGVNNVYPISSFSAYAKGNTPLDTAPLACNDSTTAPPCADAANSNGPIATAYWRVCLRVVTERGNAQDTVGTTSNQNNTNYSKNVTVMAITRCAVQNEPAGSNFNVFSN